MRKYFAVIPAMLIFLLVTATLHAQVVVTSTATPYTQNFNTLITSGTSSTLPTGWRLLETGTNANTTLAADAGSGTTGNTYSYGTGTNTDRAFGGLQSGSLLPTIGVQIRNSTGSTITSLTISYTGEQWRCGTAGRTDQLDFQYSLTATSLSTGTWTDFNALDFVSPSTATTGAKDGNAAANRTVRSSVITGLSIANNATFWIRWNDFGASGADDGLSVDDFSIQLNGSDVTPPTTTAFNPTNGATGVALSGNLVITFSENIQKGTAGNIIIKRTSDNVAVQTTAVTSASVTVSSATATIPFSGLANSVSYYVNIDAGAFRDLAGNNYAGISSTAAWAFTTLAPPAATVTVNPTSLSFGFVAAGSSSAVQTFAYTTTNISSSLTLTSPAGFEISRDGSSFSGSVVYTQTEAQAGQTVQVRFTPTVANTNYNGLINFTSTGLNDNKVNLDGNSNTGTTLNHYFGNMHAHSSYSDGNADNTTKIPADDYAYAKTALCMDFLGISEHNHATAGMSITNWQPGRSQAAAATTSSFVGMYGMEWGVISGGGHVIVYGMDSLIGWEAGNYDIFVTKNVYTGSSGLFNRLNIHGGNALAYLAHPNNTDYNNILNSIYDVSADNAIVGSAVESGPAFSTNTTYTNPGTSMSYLSYYRNMLAKGYHLGPTIDHDNHNMTFGHTAKTRLVIMAPSLTENSLLSGMRQMRFYASQDCGARITYTVNTQPLGSIITQAGAPVINVSSTGTASAISSVAIMFGVPGSGTAATQLTSIASGNFTYTDNALANGSQRYYYLDITEADGSRIVTAPVWYTRNDAARYTAPEVTSFFTINEPDRVILKWTTENEAYDQEFEVQRSLDEGRTYTSLGQLAGRGSLSKIETYSLTDLHPYAGIIYYRLIQRSRDGAVNFTDIKVVDRSAIPVTYYTVYPNPVKNILTINVSSVAAEKTMVELYDLNGRRMTGQYYNIMAGKQSLSLDMSRLGNGTYILKMILGGKSSSQLINKF
ncbi:MAG: T9SS type A sorting domain-containing protein [Chitinophagaceae bacterium]|nr:T9SS type A sorting domain-containing protein [Chitinophagaceae bacterium]